MNFIGQKLAGGTWQRTMMRDNLKALHVLSLVLTVKFSPTMEKQKSNSFTDWGSFRRTGLSQERSDEGFVGQVLQDAFDLDRLPIV